MRKRRRAKGCIEYRLDLIGLGNRPQYALDGILYNQFDCLRLSLSLVLIPADSIEALTYHASFGESLKDLERYSAGCSHHVDADRSVEGDSDKYADSLGIKR
jgi:hypothetical protein